MEAPFTVRVIVLLHAMAIDIALVQFEPNPNPEENLATATRYIERAANRGADLVLLPEIWNVGYFAFDGYREHAEPIDGPTATRLADLAEELGIHLHAGSIVEASDEDLYNTSLLFDPSGERVGSYRKIHLFGYESEESRLLTPGERIEVVDTSIGTVGLTTCYDLRFPELYRALCDAGAELFLVTSAWPHGRLDHWTLFARTRAVEEQVFLAAANLTGRNREVDLAGNSLVVDPWGVPRANAGTDEGVTLARIDLDAVERTRNEFPVLDDRRLDPTDG
ncbi:carbon-nitrogen family hydrolase [Halococcus sp. IIIV-5B]|uniref:carbon-nitrogen family hydrolase n=1 Tax=Halococcus sp. IIIV-5B TaxID=2321230 RepID=UPI000E756C1A|nr:carbon-nitrogen family hydrolase [Halococcus sp. IIIV-5B]